LNSQVWPHATIRELIAIANVHGEARARLSSAREAELFRQAIYSFRKLHNVGYDLRITINGLTVVLSKKPTVVILQQTEQQEL
jgi:hypothetical protein